MASILTVSQLNTYLSFYLSRDAKLKNVAVMGEITNLRDGYGSGHIYFKLKDDGALISAVMFRSSAEKLKLRLADGMSILAIGDVSYYEETGSLQLVCKSVAPQGAGIGKAKLEALKEKLSSEGVFDVKNKKPLPPMPRKIGIVTSLNGAALQDILNIIGRRCPTARVLISPSYVQGANAVSSICDAIGSVDSMGCDVIILARGGGSAEDLSAFNDERIVRAVFNCKTPIISAVGHQTDTTLSDYAADRRAATPSEAAELAVPQVKNQRAELLAAEKALNWAMRVRLSSEKLRLSSAELRLRSFSPLRKFRRDEENLTASAARIYSAVRSRIDRECGSLLASERRLEALSPLAVLKRGYAVVTDENGRSVSGESVNVGSRIIIRSAEYELTANVEKVDRHDGGL